MVATSRTSCPRKPTGWACSSLFPHWFPPLWNCKFWFLEFDILAPLVGQSIDCVLYRTWPWFDVCFRSSLEWIGLVCSCSLNDSKVFHCIFIPFSAIKNTGILLPIQRYATLKGGFWSFCTRVLLCGIFPFSPSSRCLAENGRRRRFLDVGLIFSPLCVFSS